MKAIAFALLLLTGCEHQRRVDAATKRCQDAGGVFVEDLSQSVTVGWICLKADAVIERSQE